MNTIAAQILESLHSEKPVSGLTHNFYRYPARFPPELAREIIKHFSGSGELVIDPFMGGGTTIVEALALGRRAVGVDINSLAHFVSLVKTTPLCTHDHYVLREWATRRLARLHNDMEATSISIESFRYLSVGMKKYLMDTLDSIEHLGGPIQRRFARCAVLRACQSLLDCRDKLPQRAELDERLASEVNMMLEGLDDLVATCRQAGSSKHEISSRRVLLKRSVVGVETDRRILRISGQPTLVFTSPPYPGVHVLYHRWQIRGRKETSLPYWICDLSDGRTAAYYTLGSRSVSGREKYFETLISAFKSVSRIIHPEALVVQLIGFSEIETQLPIYSRAMEKAGYIEVFPIMREGQRLWRDVPNRKWYAREQHDWDAAREVLLFHRLSRNQI